LYNCGMERRKKKWTILTIVLLITVVGLFINLLLLDPDAVKVKKLNEDATIAKAKDLMSQGMDIYNKALEIEDREERVKYYIESYNLLVEAHEIIEELFRYYEEKDRKPPESLIRILSEVEFNLNQISWADHRDY